MQVCSAFIIFILLAAGFTTAAQKSFSEGYIVTLTNDTIKGKIKDYFPARFSIAPKKIAFIDSSGIEKVYLPKDLSGYSKADIANYLSVDVGNGKNFVKVEIDGYISLLSIKGKGTSTMLFPQELLECNQLVEGHMKQRLFTFSRSKTTLF